VRGEWLKLLLPPTLQVLRCKLLLLLLLRWRLLLRRMPNRLGEKELLWWRNESKGGFTGRSSRAPGGMGTVLIAA
jgi:hypothetical protein